jgi:cytochrome oxidase Cu insertion factor (SCO1/SenC/PrrC family)
MRRKLGSIGLILFALAAAGSPVGSRAQQLPLTPDRPLLFIDAQGTLVRSTDFPGKWLLVYFGYTHCSDICPTGLSVMAGALEQIGAAGDHVQPLFVTVDPERDSGPLLRAFTASFDRRLIGLSGSVEQIRQAADALGVSFRKVASGESDYVVDHSSNYTLIDPMHTQAEVLRIAEPHVLASKLIEVMTKAGVPLDNVNNVAAYR